ncbi:MAG: hypothetical protein WAR79_18075 [Melioribacteraceae bacterium]
MKKISSVFLALFLLSSVSFAQFEVGKHHAGPAVGLSFLGSTLSLGANYEYGMSLKDIGVDAPGTLGIGGIFRYWSYDTGYWSYTDIVIAAQGNYHFKLDNNKIDPYLGLVIGYDIGSWDWDGPYDYDWDDSYGGFIFGGSAGCRYWFSPSMALNARLGTGSNFGSTLDLGLDFKF